MGSGGMLTVKRTPAAKALRKNGALPLVTTTVMAAPQDAGRAELKIEDIDWECPVRARGAIRAAPR